MTLKLSNLSKDGKDVGDATVTYPDLSTIQDIMARIITKNSPRLDRLHRESTTYLHIVSK